LAIPAGVWSPSRSPVCSPTGIKAIPGITDVTTDQLNAGPMLDITIKREVASSYGIMPYAIEVEKELGKQLSLETSFQGNAQAFGASLSSTPILIAAALFVIYFVLGVLYESLIHPITIISTLPSAGLGALLLLMAIHCDLSVIAIVGVEKLLRIDLDATHGPVSFVRQLLDRLPERVTAFGKTAGFVINYSPDKAVRFDRNGQPIATLDKAVRPGTAVLLRLGGRPIAAGRNKTHAASCARRR
jgi:AcrB/AcrD/AcrF family